MNLLYYKTTFHFGSQTLYNSQQRAIIYGESREMQHHWLSLHVDEWLSIEGEDYVENNDIPDDLWEEAEQYIEDVPIEALTPDTHYTHLRHLDDWFNKLS